MGGLVTGTGNARAPLSERGDDFYATPEPAVWALLEHYAQPPRSLPFTIWEPACGDGAIVGMLRRAGHKVIATDLVDWGCPDSSSHIDFLMEQHAADRAGAIITNPPFKLAEEFVAHARRLCPIVIMLLRLAFLESERRSDILDSGDLARVLVFRKRLPFMHRAGYEGPRHSNSGMAFAWFIWDRNHQGPTTIERISWKPLSEVKEAA